jgi:cytochrome c-type protein NapB
MNKIVITSIATLALATASMAAVNSGACKGCHGASFEKHALGKSKIVKDLSHAEIAEALKGYKAGTFGGPMKGVMKGQVAKYSDADLEAFAQTIGK